MTGKDDLKERLLKLAFSDQGDQGGEDMEIDEDRIPEFADHMEQHFKSRKDTPACFQFWNQKLCYGE